MKSVYFFSLSQPLINSTDVLRYPSPNFKVSTFETELLKTDEGDSSSCTVLQVLIPFLPEVENGRLVNPLSVYLLENGLLLPVLSPDP